MPPGNALTAVKNKRPRVRDVHRPAENTGYIGRSFFAPQYWLEMTATPSPAAVTTICSRNCIWFARAAPLSASEE